MKILMVAGAHAIHTVRWANALHSRGVAIAIATIHSPLPELAEGIDVHIGPWRPPLGYFTCVPWLRALINRYAPTVVHAHYAAGYGTLATLARPHGLIISVWGSDVYEVPDKTRLHRAIIRHNLRQAKEVLSTSYTMAARTRHFTEKPIRVTPFGVDLRRFQPAPARSPFAPGTIVIGTVKTLHPKYGVAYLIQAFGILRRERPSARLGLLIVGGGPQLRQLEALAAREGVLHETIFTGAVPHKEVVHYHNALDVAVYPSTWESESFGVSIIESGACERAVIASRVGGLPEVIEDGVTGMLVAPCDARAIADAIKALVDDPGRRMAMGKAARQRVAELYDWERSVDTMISIYEDVSEEPWPDSDCAVRGSDRR